MTTMEDESDQITLKFRNYAPRDDTLREFCLEPATPVAATELLKKFNELNPDDDDDTNTTFSLAPKNPNWDLKRDIAKHMELLEHQTQKAIIELIREKLKAEGGDEPEGNDLVEAVNAKIEMEQDE